MFIIFDNDCILIHSRRIPLLIGPKCTGRCHYYITLTQALSGLKFAYETEKYLRCLLCDLITISLRK